MIDWRRGGWTGSLNKWVRREVREHMRTNSAARRCRYPWPLRLLRSFFADRAFMQFVAIYIGIAALVAALEIIMARYLPGLLPQWTRSGPPGTDIKALVTNVASYLITAQVGVLGVIAIAIGLVTLIAQREDAGTDVKVYYHESFAVEVVASSLALLFVLIAQLLWPLQFLLHRFGEGTELQVFKLFLTTVHMSWLLVNLSGLAHFITTTFRFVQKSAREQLRERYTANIVQPVEMTRQLRLKLYEMAGSDLIEADTAGGTATQQDDLVVTFGFDWGKPTNVELEKSFVRPAVVHDVRVRWVRWVAKRWWRRCLANLSGGRDSRIGGLAADKPLLVFTPQLDEPLRGKVAWCWRRGGVPLTRFERWVVERSFKFGKASDEP
jgi:hypothetical protein